MLPTAWSVIQLLTFPRPSSTHSHEGDRIAMNNKAHHSKKFMLKGRMQRTPKTGRSQRMRSMLVLLLALAVSWLALDESAQAKRQRAPRKEPDLKILAVTLRPDPYVLGQGTLYLIIKVELPQKLDDATILEVSSLISSPSKRSIRFLAERQPVGTLAQSESTSVSVTLRWNGVDQTKQLVSQGRYDYEVRAKLLAVEGGDPRTQMTSWPKRGTVEVR